jgi:hypothetical protein
MASSLFILVVSDDGGLLLTPPPRIPRHGTTPSQSVESTCTRTTRRTFASHLGTHVIFFKERACVMCLAFDVQAKGYFDNVHKSATA